MAPWCVHVSQHTPVVGDSLGCKLRKISKCLLAEQFASFTASMCRQINAFLLCMRSWKDCSVCKALSADMMLAEFERTGNTAKLVTSNDVKRPHRHIAQCCAFVVSKTMQNTDTKERLHTSSARLVAQCSVTCSWAPIVPDGILSKKDERCRPAYTHHRQTTNHGSRTMHVNVLN
jgi:hypothetical protein